MSSLPPLPAGFELEGQAPTAAPSIPPLPAGFQMEQPKSITSAITDIPSEIYNAGASAIGSMNDAFNPNSDYQKQKFERIKNSSFLGGLGEQVKSVGDVGSGLMGIPALASAPVTGAARSVIGNTFDAMNPLTPEMAAKNGLPYQSGRDVADLAMSALAPSGASPIGLRSGPAAIPSAPELKSAAVSGYDAAKNSGVEFKPSSIKDFTTKVTADLNADGLNEIVAPKTFGILDKMGTPPPGSTVTTNDYRTMQRALGMAAKSIDPTEKLAASRAIEALNKHIENIPAADLLKGTPADAAAVSATIKEANANYAASKRSDMLSGKLDRADLNAASANSGANVDNSIRQQIKSILVNPKLRRGYSADELAQMEKIVRGTSLGNMVRTAGNLMGGGGGLGGVVSGAAGYATAGPAGIATPLAGYGLKKLGNSMTAAQIEKLSNMIRSRAPLATSMPQTTIAAPGGIGGTLGASLLSSVSPRALFPFLAGQMPAYADQKQRR